MPSTYDARAIAEVMGIAFLRSPGTCPSPSVTASATGKGTPRSSTRGSSGDFIIAVDDAVVLVVDARDNTTFSQRRPSGGRPDHGHDFEDDLILSPSPILIEKAVENGLPRQALRRVAERLAGSDKAKASRLEWGIVPRTTLGRRGTRLSPQESERTERVARLLVNARRALGTEAEARQFMTTPHPRFDGRSPVDAAGTDPGGRRVEQILDALEYGLAL